MKFLVTGGMGFIGSNLVSRLLEEKHDVTVVDDMSAGELAFLPKGFENFFICDFANDFVLEKIKERKFDVVMHLAAKPRVPYSVDYPFDSNESNVSKTLKLLEACRGNIGRFMNTSSSSVYGNANCYPTPETHVHQPESPYALQKSITEQYCKLFSNLYKLDTVSVRPFNVFGPHSRGSNPYSTAISAWFSAVKEERFLRSDGTGEQSRDVTYVDNVVDIMYRAATSERSFSGDAFNAGTGISYSNNEILSWFQKKYPSCKVLHAPPRPGDVLRTTADIAKTKEVLGYKVLVSLEEGLHRMNEWVMKDIK